MNERVLAELQKRLFRDQPRCGHARWAVRMKPAESVSGDVLCLWGDSQTEQLHGFVGDVMGHGIAAAFVATALRSVFLERQRDTWMQHFDAANCFLHMSDFDPMYCTGIGFSLNKSGQMSMLNAGHSDAIVLRNSGEVLSFPSDHSAPLGLFDELSAVDLEMIQLAPRDRVLILSDGLLERSGEKTKTKMLPNEVRFELIQAACTGSLKQDADIMWDLLVGINADHQIDPDDQSLLLLEYL